MSLFSSHLLGSGAQLQLMATVSSVILDVSNTGFFLWQLGDLQVPRWVLLQLCHWVVLWRHDHFLPASGAWFTQQL